MLPPLICMYLSSTIIFPFSMFLLIQQILVKFAKFYDSRLQDFICRKEYMLNSSLFHMNFLELSEEFSSKQGSLPSMKIQCKLKRSRNIHAGVFYQSQLLKQNIATTRTNFQSASTFSQDLHISIYLFDSTKTATLVVFCPCCTAGRPAIKSKDLFWKMQKYIYFFNMKNQSSNPHHLP